MYFRSVQFYKHLILIAIALVVLASIGSCALLAVSNHQMKKVLKENGLALTGENAASFSPAKKQTEAQRLYYPASFDYQQLYPNLFIDNDYNYLPDQPHSVYLTFDDGPSSLTSQILDILKKYHIKATFFIVYNDSPEAQVLYKRMIAEGHTIGVHSTTHQYQTIYRSAGAFLDDFAQTALMLEQSTGVKPEIFRFPGGSINSYNKAVYPQIIAEMLRRGYTYYDWNVSADDATGGATRQQIYSNVINEVQKYDRSIVLLHDLSNKTDTASALPAIIDKLTEEGYSFYPLTKEVRPVAFNYID
ncbi:polysaccharide deacetylase [Aminipila butyrica]|uniref:Polysaccharide deacetylase n=1 Tax=Aminipila butyrica TaxID=433296 RepID=A0A858BQS1_9FIRM|nr:polysaccharide deacetylase family protein [Aminipila butyrica]QIB68221.1 polysaccharide deacetylase [Aminipila butyrica]